MTATNNSSELDVSASPTYSLYRALKDLCKNNADYFREDESESGQRLHAGFLALIDHVDNILPLVDDVRKIAPSFDLDSKSPGNGYRSFVAAVDTCVKLGVKINSQTCVNRDSFLFRKASAVRDIEACGHVMASLGTCMQHLKTLIGWSEPGELFPREPHSPEELLKQAESINMYCFYGRLLGFQFCESMQTVLKTISICMASFSEIYYGNGGLWSKATNSVLTGGKYLLDPELRARRIVNISQHANIDFCKSFWLLAESEMMGRLPGMVCPSLAVNQVVMLPPEPLTLDGVEGQKVSIPVPQAHIGPKPLQVRLLSGAYRKGMPGAASCQLPPSPHLIVHLHGGGFVAQSSRSHESYLRDWAIQLGCPILSIDYSLAPEAPFPRALEEAVYAYSWALANASLLGSTAERILLAGDSAGGNLCLGVSMRCSELCLRQPDGLFLAYVPVLVSFVPSPSRLLCLMDPLLPFGFMIRCLKAYACGEALSTDSDTESFGAEESDLAARKSMLSLSGASGSDTLTTVSLTSLQPEPDQNQKDVLNNSERYVSEFLDKYVLDSEIDSEGRQVPVLRTEKGCDEHVLFELPHDLGIGARLGKAAGSIANGFRYVTGRSQSKESNKSVTSSENSLKMSTLDSLMQRSPSADLCFTVPRDPYLSPYWASDEVLKKLPAISLLSVEMDPCLDDCVMFAKKLRGFGKNVTLDVLEGLPHGFLNFSLLSKDAHHGSNVCVKRMIELLGACDK